MAHKRKIQLICIILLIGYTTPATACNTCTMALFDYFFPPLIVWQFFPIIWFLSICIITNRDDSYKWGIPNLLMGFIISIGTVVFGNAFGFGPFPTLILLIPCIIFSLNSLRKIVREEWGRNQSKKNVIMSVVGSISFFSFIGLSIYVHFDRTPAEYVIAWGINGPGHNVIEKVKKNPTSDLGQIRLIVSKADDFAVTELAETLAKRGDPIIDFPILLDALRRVRKSSLNYGEDKIESALKILTGIELERGANIEKWKAAFRLKITNKSANKANSKNEYQ